MVPMTSTRRVRSSKCGRVQIAPGISGDEILEIGVEGILVRDGFVDPGIAKHLSALDHALVTALLIVHHKFSRSMRGAKRPKSRLPPGRDFWIASLRSQRR